MKKVVLMSYSNLDACFVVVETIQQQSWFIACFVVMETVQQRSWFIACFVVMETIQQRSWFNACFVVMETVQQQSWFNACFVVMETVQQRSRFVTSVYRDKLKLALDFRNRFASRPYLCDASIDATVVSETMSCLPE